MSVLEKPRRVELLDEIRGLCILLMVVYHGFYDLIYLFALAPPSWLWDLMAFAQPFVAGIFILISGIACRYSRSNLKRGLIALALGAGITLFTWLFLPEEVIWYGILHFLGTSMVLFSLLRPFLERFSPMGGLAGCGLLFLLTYQVPRGLVGIPGLPGIRIPPALYAHHWLMPLGIGGAGADYFPLIPWFFLFLAGACLGVLFVQGDMPGGFYRSRAPFLARVGRHTLLIYVLHQPVVYGLLWAIFRIVARN